MERPLLLAVQHRTGERLLFLTKRGATFSH